MKSNLKEKQVINSDQNFVLDVERSVLGKKWKFNNIDTRMAEGISQAFGLPEIVGSLLVSRGIDFDSVDDFLNPSIKKHLPDPSTLKDMDKAARQIEIAFEIAQHHDADIDMHVDETDDPYWHTLELLAEKTIETGYQGRVTAAHCCAMAAWDEKLFQRILQKLVEAQVNICTNTPVNLVIQGRNIGHPIRRGIPRVKDLLEAGVNVTCGQDDLLNMFYPFGNMDKLSDANFVAHAAHMSSPAEIQEAFDLPRYRAAKVFGIKEYGLEVGFQANLVLFRAAIPADAIRWVFDLNLLGTVMPSQVFGKHMTERGSGIILNVSSMNAFRPLTKIAAYSSAKAAVSNFTQWLAVHMSHNYSANIRVNAIAPGFFLTEQNRYLLIDRESGAFTERGQAVVDHTPLGRLGDPSELVGTVLWLLSDGASFVHGAVIPVDGGFSAFSGV